MRSFFKIFFASLLALIIFSIIGFFVIVGVVASASSPSKPDIGEKAVLVLDLAVHYNEQKQENPLGMLIGDADDIPGLFEVVRLIGKAKADSSIKGIYIKCSSNANGFAASEELRNALVDFKKSKKFVIAYGEVISQGAYYIANIADRIYCNPQGSVEWKGYASTMMYFTGALDRLEIKPQIYYAGKFKSATEPFREYKMTDANRIQTSVYINDLYGRLLTTTATQSGMDTAALHGLANTWAIQTAQDAVKYKLIDAAKYDDEVKSEIEKLTKADAGKINFVTIGRYAKATSLTSGEGERIAVIYAEGEIVDGKGADGQIGSDVFRNLIRKVRLDDNIKAIVLRVNSPGGSSLASEVIYRELQLAKATKPLVVSFGDVAASGGYYIACGADSIFAQPNSITGSIGVFTVIPNFKDFFDHKLGITFDRVTTGPFADMIPVDRPLTATEGMYVQNAVNNIYDTFKLRVATGRKKPVADVDSIAQGRVWTGERAIKIGLVDKLGSLQQAIDCAARMAKVSKYRVKDYPEQKPFLETFIGNYKDETKVKMVKAEIGDDQYLMLKKIQTIRSLFYIPQARLPFDVNIH